jgi:uncharacterized protein
VLKLNIANILEGHVEHKVTVKPSELDLDEQVFQSPVDILFEIEKINRNIFINLHIKTKLNLICDRCAEPFAADLDDSLKLLYTYDPELYDKDDEDVIVINRTATEIDFKEPVRQTMAIAVPIKQLCSDNCQGLCAFCGTNLNIGSCDCRHQEIDPRWEKLRDLES